MKKIILVGSSIFEAWGIPAGLDRTYAIRNRAVGGTITSYWRHSILPALANENPDAVLYYCGSNDINENIAPQDIIANTLHCRQLIRSAYPAARFGYFGIIKAPQKLGKWDLIDSLNSTIQLNLAADDLYLESNHVFLENGHPLEQYYLEDGLHLTSEAYAALSAYSTPIITRWLG